MNCVSLVAPPLKSQEKGQVRYDVGKGWARERQTCHGDLLLKFSCSRDCTVTQSDLKRPPAQTPKIQLIKTPKIQLIKFKYGIIIMGGNFRNLSFMYVDRSTWLLIL